MSTPPKKFIELNLQYKPSSKFLDLELSNISNNWILAAASLLLIFINNFPPNDKDVLIVFISLKKSNKGKALFWFCYVLIFKRRSLNRACFKDHSVVGLDLEPGCPMNSTSDILSS